MAVNINIPSQVTQTITDGVTSTAPSENAVHDALALKANSADVVPYTGAVSDVDLGQNAIKVEKVYMYDGANDNYGSLHYSDSDFHIEDADGHPLLVIEDGFMQLHLSQFVQSNLYTTNLTQTRDHYLPDASGTIALTSDIPNIQVDITSPTGGAGLEYNASTSKWIDASIQYTIELIDALTVDFYAPYNMKIDSVTNIKNSPTITLKKEGATYTLGTSITAGNKITVQASVAGVVNLNISKI